MKMRVLGMTIMALTAAASTVAAQNILVYDDNSDFGAVQEALGVLGLSYTLTTATDFTSTLTGMTWDLVVMDNPTSEPDGGWQDALVAHIVAGGAAIHTHWNSGSLAGLPVAFEVSAGSEKNSSAMYRWNSHPLFASPQTVPDNLTDVEDLWGSNGFYLEPTGPAEAAAGFTAGPSANQASIVIGNGGRTIFNGFLFDDFYNSDLDTDGTSDVVELIINEVSWVTGDIQVRGTPIPSLGQTGILVLITLVAAAGVLLVRRTSFFV